jgi:hypothetical protein
MIMIGACMLGSVSCKNKERQGEGEYTPLKDITSHNKYALQEETEQKILDSSSNGREKKELTVEEMLEYFYEHFYSELSQEEIEERIWAGSTYYKESGYYEEMTDYWENTREVRDIANKMEPLFFTDMKYYTEEDFTNVPLVVIHLAKNEIYAKHGYIFVNEDLNNYFMGCAWYEPVCGKDQFNDQVFNDYERKNLELLTKLEKELK